MLQLRGYQLGVIFGIGIKLFVTFLLRFASEAPITVNLNIKYVGLLIQLRILLFNLMLDFLYIVQLKIQGPVILSLLRPFPSNLIVNIKSICDG